MIGMCLALGVCPALLVLLCTVQKPVPAKADRPATAASIVKTTEQSTRLINSGFTQVLISDTKSYVIVAKTNAGQEEQSTIGESWSLGR